MSFKPGKHQKASAYPARDQEKEEEGTKGSSDESNDPEFVSMPHMDEGGVVEKPSRIAELLQQFARGHNGLGVRDFEDVENAKNVDPTPNYTPQVPNAAAMTPEQMVALQGQAMPHMADGGLVDDFDVNTGDSSTVHGMPLSPAAVPPQKMSPEEDFANRLSGANIAAGGPDALDAFNETIGKNQPQAAPQAAPTALVSRAAKGGSLPGMPANISPDALAQYIQGQKTALQKYGPEDTMRTEANLMRARTSPGASVAQAGAGLADAIMQGVARAGNPGFQEKLMAQGNQLAGEGMNALDKARQAQVQNIEADQKLDMMDPKSPISKIYAQAFAPIFQKMGYSPEAVAKMPAGQIQTIADLGVRYADAQTQLELKKALLGVQSLTATANIANQQSERRQEALKQVAGMPWYSRLMHPGISSALEKEAGLTGGDTFAPDVLNYAKAHGITAAQAQAIKDKRTAK